MALEAIKNEAIADVEYFIHEIEENNRPKTFSAKLEKGLKLIGRSTSEIEIKDHMKMMTFVFQKAFK